MISILGNALEHRKCDNVRTHVFLKQATQRFAEFGTMGVPGQAKQLMKFKFELPGDRTAISA